MDLAIIIVLFLIGLILLKFVGKIVKLIITIGLIGLIIYAIQQMTTGNLLHSYWM